MARSLPKRPSVSVPLFIVGLSFALLAIAFSARRRRSGAPFVRARPRGLPFVHSTIRVARGVWRNWSGELVSRPGRLYCDDAGGPWRSPRTLEDLQAIVRDARAEGATVRVFGSSHSWAQLVPTEGYLVDNRLLNSTGGRFNLRLDPEGEGGARPARVTVPPGMLSSELERWLWEMGYSLPSSAFEDCFTVGGMVSTATHGVGLEIPTLSDMVVGVTFVDGRGEVRRWTRETATPDELAAVQCGLGCLGLLHDVTLEVVPRYEVLHVARTHDYDTLFADTDAARAALRALHEAHTSVEFFWWPFAFAGVPFLSRVVINPRVWVLATQREIPAGARPRGALRRFLHLQVGDLLSMSFSAIFFKALRRLPRRASLIAWLNGFTNLWVALRSGAFRMPQYDANHFVNAASVEFLPCRASEWSVPFRPGAALAEADGWERVRRSFAVLHDLVVEAFEAYPFMDPRATPVNLAVEMRTLAPSTALLSPGFRPPAEHAAYRYAAPEVVTTADHPAWDAFVHRANLHMIDAPEVLGDEVLCHLAKPCHAFPHPRYPVGGTAAYLRARYQAAGTWQRFLAVREAVDPDGVFLNDYLRSWFYPAAAEASQPQRAAA
jgi:FAD/FMN-containing dehydrogenase